MRLRRTTSRRNKLDAGAFGAVYRGRLPQGAEKHGGREVAIKVLTKRSAGGKAQTSRGASSRTGTDSNARYGARESFKREAEVLASYRHPNIVALLGHCIKEGVELRASCTSSWTASPADAAAAAQGGLGAARQR